MNPLHIDIDTLKKTAVISFEGRLDTAATLSVQAGLRGILDGSSGVEQVTWDASGMTYISSSGLRIVLLLKKTFPSFYIYNVSPEVYHVFEMTGFTKMMTVERELRQMSVAGCEVVGRGGVGVVYRVSPDTIIKVFRDGTRLEAITNEIAMAKEAFVLGMPTAISFDMVRVGAQYGLVYELLNAHTLSDYVKQSPGRIDECARLYAQLFRQLHAIKVPPGNHQIPDFHARGRQSLELIRRHFSADLMSRMEHILDAVPAARCLLHGDLQAKNAMLQGDELMLIDMGEIGYGHPMMDLAFSYSSMVGCVGDYEAVVGLPRELGVPLWNKMLQHYFEGESEELIAHRHDQIRVLSYVRNVSWLTLSDYPEEVIEECRVAFEERAIEHWDLVVEICKTFSDWVV